MRVKSLEMQLMRRRWAFKVKFLGNFGCTYYSLCHLVLKQNFKTVCDFQTQLKCDFPSSIANSFTLEQCRKMTEDTLQSSRETNIKKVSRNNYYFKR